MKTTRTVATGLATLGALLLVSACAGPTPKEAAEETKVKIRQDVNDEVTIGRDMAARLLGTFKHYPNPAAREYVNLVGQTLARQAGRPELEYKFAVLNTKDMNAYACPGGFIFITKGLLETLTSESELGGVLAHEIAHVNERHMYEAIIPRRQIGVTEVIARFLTRGYGDLGASLSKIVDQGMSILLRDGYGKEKEFAADQAGVTYAQLVGYDPAALLAVIDRLGQRGNSTVVMSKTHPPNAERIALLRRYLAENGLDRLGVVASQVVLKTRFEKVLSTVEKGQQ